MGIVVWALVGFAVFLVGFVVFIFTTKPKAGAPRSSPEGHPYLIAIRNGTEIVAPLGEGEFTIGRNDRENVVRTDKLLLHDAEGYVSRKHASIEFEHGTYFVRDAGSTNGLWINGQRVSGRRPLESGDGLRLGGVDGIEVVFHDPRKSSGEDFPPSPWGEWEFLKYLNGGGMARVYLGRSKGPEASKTKEIAIKVPRHGTEKFEELCAMLMREGACMKRLDHPNVVKVFRYGTLPCNWPYLAMEVVGGGTLRDLMKKHGGYLPEAKALEILSQIAGALDYIHGEGVIHCDIKPDNVLLVGDSVKLADFGIAITANEGYGQDWCSYHYISPEHFEGEPLDHRSDIYMLGCLTHEMLTGRVPFEGDEEKVGEMKATVDGPSIRERFSELQISPKTDELVQNMLKRARDDRPRDARTAVTAL